MNNNQIAKVILADYKKANKKRKEAILKKYGFTSESALFEAAKEPVVSSTSSSKKAVKSKKKKVSERITIHNVDILDATGSMAGSKYENSKKGIIEGIEALQKDNAVDWTYSLFEFVDSYKGVVEHRILGDLSTDIKFNGPIGANTPLYKTIFDVLTKINGLVVNKNNKVLVRIYTDGGDNSSGNLRVSAKDLIHVLNSENFTITFVATKQDMESIQRRLDLDKSNTLAVDNTGDGFEKAFRSSNLARTSYAISASLGEDVSTGYFKDIN